MITKVNKEEQAYNFLKNMIISGELSPDNVYSEGELAKLFEISRTPVRSAIQSLSKDGLVIIHPNKGFSIKKFGKKDISEVYELRKALESYAIEKIIIQKKNINRLLGIIEKLKACANKCDRAAVIEQDRKFHIELIKQVGNKQYELFFDRLRILISAMGLQLLMSPSQFKKSAEEHENILIAIEKGDFQEAKKALYFHFDKYC
jgi:DNA-binding GntR family transcriptional regulator